mmetsp:Transcript_2338/g.5516  ORF Transcript_2338/g.5516 Transcript_2338/m.5516 type:complete len:106 (-) Transcript_2338:506-823(-)
MPIGYQWSAGKVIASEEFVEDAGGSGQLPADVSGSPDGAPRPGEGDPPRGAPGQGQRRALRGCAPSESPRGLSRLPAAAAAGGRPFREGNCYHLKTSQMELPKAT